MTHAAWAGAARHLGPWAAALALAAAWAGPAWAVEGESPTSDTKAEPKVAAGKDGDEDATVTGTVEVASKYVQRGMTDRADNEGLSVQPGLTVKLPWGFVFDYWGASCDYPTAEVSHTYDSKGGLVGVSLSNPRRAFENDLTLMWTVGAGDFTFKLGGQYMYFMHATENNVPEVYAEIEGSPTIAKHPLGDFTLVIEYMLTKSPWTNPNDAYFLLTHQYPLADKWSSVWQVGTYLYGKSSSNLATISSFNLRHFDVGLQRKFDNGIYMRGMYLVGGYDRLAQHLPNTQVWFLGYEF